MESYRGKRRIKINNTLKLRCVRVSYISSKRRIKINNTLKRHCPECELQRGKRRIKINNTLKLYRVIPVLLEVREESKSTILSSSTAFHQTIDKVREESKSTILSSLKMCGFLLVFSLI